MGLCKRGERGGNMIYKLGKAREYWDRWTGATLGQQREWRALVLAAAVTVRNTCVHFLGINWFTGGSLTHDVN
jgi:hypothetical protein